MRPNKKIQIQKSAEIEAYDSEVDLDLFPPTSTRLAPVGANAEDDAARKAEVMRSLLSEAEQQEAHMCDDGDAHELRRRLEEMEEEQEELNSSLMSMTSHFAKVKEDVFF